MPVFEKVTAMPVDAAALWAWHAAPGAFARLVPPWSRVDLQLAPVGLSAGTPVRLRQKVGPVWTTWESRITESQEPRGFVDEAGSSPFRSWRHAHTFDDRGVADTITWEVPGGALGGWLVARRVEAELARAFAWRHRVTAEDLALHARFRHLPRLVVGVTGASGLVGMALCALLTSGGHTVVPFVRRGGDGIPWDPAKGVLDPERLAGLDAIVHLAGESVAQRWTPAAKERILQSRVGGTSLLAGAVARCSRPPGVLVNASAVGFYGDRREPVDEASARGDGFLADVVTAWEAAAEGAGTRVVSLRLGTVVSGRGGALAAMLPAFRAGLGGPMGSGRQAWPWVSLDDVVGMAYHALLDATWRGPVNTVAPEQVTQGELASALGRALARPACTPAPAPVLKAAMGEMAQRLLLEGAPVVPRRATELGYRWRRPSLAEALAVELGQER